MNPKQSLILAVAGLVAVASAAAAAPFGTNGTAVKMANKTDATKWDLYLANQGTAEVSANLLGQVKIRTAVANGCGLATFADSLTTPNSGVAGFAALAVQTIPTCTGSTLAEPRTADFKTSDGKIVKVGTVGSSQTITVPVTKLKKGTPKAGLLKLSALSNGTGNDVAIGTGNWDLGTVPTVTAPPIARKNAAGGYDLFVPSNWVP
jgi:hypothetical protein